MLLDSRLRRFPYEQPRDLIENVCRRYVERTSLGRDLLSSTGVGAAILEAAVVLGSVGHFETHSETTARRLAAGLRAMWEDKDIEVGGVWYTLRFSAIRMKLGRERGARLLAMAKTA